jgi:hypothetical protein
MTIPNRHMFGATTALLMLVAAVPAVSAGEVAIIANSSFKADVVSEGDARDVFLGESNSVSGAKVVPVVLQKGGAQEAFLRLIGKSESALQATWRRQVFTGKGTMPRSFDSEEALLDYVSATPGAIGYASPGKTLAGVKVLKLK